MKAAKSMKRNISVVASQRICHLVIDLFQVVETQTAPMLSKRKAGRLRKPWHRVEHEVAGMRRQAICLRRRQFLEMR